MSTIIAILIMSIIILIYRGKVKKIIRRQAIKNGKLTEQLQAAEIECVRLNNKIEELESMLSEESDLVSRIALRNALYDADAITMQGVKIINQFPAVNAVEVVHCRDCEVPHNKYTGCPMLNGLVTPPDFYCPFGERNDGDK